MVEYGLNIPSQTTRHNNKIKKCKVMLLLYDKCPMFNIFAKVKLPFYSKFTIFNKHSESFDLCKKYVVDVIDKAHIKKMVDE